jgi:hypothetical protein
VTAFADSQVTYVDLAGEAWGSYRLFIGGRDVTFYRGIPAQIGSYQLIEPLSFGPADFMLPQLTMFEVDEWGTGALKWFDIGKRVVLKQVDASGAVVRTVWRGFVSIPQVTSKGTAIHCEGEAQGRLGLRDKLPDLFSLKRHAGRLLYYAMSHAGLNLSPYLGNDIGVLMDARGITGSYLDYVNELLAATIDTDGSQYTINYRESQRDYHLALKDTTTVDFTTFLGAHGVDPDLSRDIAEEPTAVYGSGIGPNGLVWVNGRYPRLVQGDAPDYPFTDGRTFGAGTTDADTDSGDGVTVLIYALIGGGYLDRRDKPGGYDSDVTEAIKDLQEEAGQSQSGDVNPATWNAAWNLDVTDESLLQAFIQPLSEAGAVKPWFRSSNGSRIARNPDYDPSVIPVDMTIDYGPSCKKSRAKRNARGIRKRIAASKNWVGTLTLTADVFAGSRTAADAGLAGHVMSRLDVTPGNMMLRNFDGDTLFHVSVVNVFGDLSVQLGIDTQGRDAASLAEVIARNIESRSHPARSWKRQHLGRVNVRQVEFSEVGGLLNNKVVCPANQWTVFEVVAGQAGSVSRVRVQTTNDEAEFVLAITAEKSSTGFWQNTVGNPFRGTGISGVYVSDGGSSYETAPTVSFSGGGGSGATATAHVGTTGTVTQIVLTDRGSGYTSAPSVSLSGGGGSGATAHTSVTLTDPWSTNKIQPHIDKARALLGAWGDAAQPCGYYPGKHSDENGLTDDPITGLLLDDGGFDFHTFAEPVLYFAIFPDRDTTIPPQRVLWPVQESDA